MWTIITLFWRRSGIDCINITILLEKRSYLCYFSRTFSRPRYRRTRSISGPRVCDTARRLRTTVFGGRTRHSRRGRRTNNIIARICEGAAVAQIRSETQTRAGPNAKSRVRLVARYETHTFILVLYFYPNNKNYNIIKRSPRRITSNRRRAAILRYYRGVAVLL